MTNSYSLSYRTGDIRSGNDNIVCTPGAQRRPNTKYPAILAHGSGGTAASWTYVLNYGSQPFASYLALQGGIPWIACDNSFQAWGNDASMTDIDNQINYLHTKFGTPANKAVLIGGSMGGLTVLRYAILNPTKVAAVVGVIPLTDLKLFYRTNVGSADAGSTSTAYQIAVAWGVTVPRAFSDLVTTNGSTAISSATAAFTAGDNGKVLWAAAGVPVGTTITYVDATHATLSTPATATTSGTKAGILTALPSGADIQSLAASLTVPTKLYYSSADTIVFPSQQTAFAAAANGGAGVPIVNVGPNGHSEQTILDTVNYSGTKDADIIAFLQAHGA
jgi:pimeloyl-ACP methyl ester carboxylesterase